MVNSHKCMLFYIALEATRFELGGNDELCIKTFICRYTRCFFVFFALRKEYSAVSLVS